MANDYRAVAKGLPVSAQKTRLVVDLVRGKDVVDGMALGANDYIDEKTEEHN